VVAGGDEGADEVAAEVDEGFGGRHDNKNVHGQAISFAMLGLELSRQHQKNLPAFHQLNHVN
jgi:hypothetical protein